MSMQVILASGSPRRREILTSQGIAFTVVRAEREEITTEILPDRMVCALSEQKAQEVCDRIESDTDVIIIAADTMVFCDGVRMGKPADEQDAIRMLQKLQGQTHQVYTGVTVLVRENHQVRRIQFAECTEVTMYPMSTEEIHSYVQTGEPMDKAGAYAIQGKCARYIAAIKGDYQNVVGLPVARLYQELKENGVFL